MLKMMVGNNLKDAQLQQIVDKTILFADKDEDGRISFDEFCVVSIFLVRAMSNLSFFNNRHFHQFTFYLNNTGCRKH